MRSTENLRGSNVTEGNERCLLMTTDPGDLVLDPTCGSGTTAFVAEQWGRRWITCDSSRVALALAKHRLMTAKFDYQQLRPLSAEDVAAIQTGRGSLIRRGRRFRQSHFSM